MWIGRPSSMGAFAAYSAGGDWWLPMRRHALLDGSGKHRDTTAQRSKEVIYRGSEIQT